MRHEMIKEAVALFESITNAIVLQSYNRGNDVHFPRQRQLARSAQPHQQR